MMDSNTFECVLTLGERKAGMAKVAKVQQWTARQTNAAVSRIIATAPHLLKAITFNKGTEFHSHKRLDARFGITCCFAAPRQPSERGTNENVNGLLRQYPPKGAKVHYAGDEKLDRICRGINTRPRKRIA